jgi:hypothetical protein
MEPRWLPGHNFSRVRSIRALNRWLSALPMCIGKSNRILFMAFFGSSHRFSRTAAATCPSFQIVLLA